MYDFALFSIVSKLSILKSVNIDYFISKSSLDTNFVVPQKCCNSCPCICSPEVRNYVRHRCKLDNSTFDNKSKLAAV